MDLLLLSNSTNAGEDYLSFPLPYIKQFLNNTVANALFIPYAGVSISWGDYYQLVKTKLSTTGISLESIHNQSDEKQAIKHAEVIIIGGGNTFHLLKTLQDKNLIPLIKEKILSGTPYIGWSAGSNIACPTICTTNDMPIVQPQNFNALGVVPFQINPHYTDTNLENHAGETREMRIEEFLIANKDNYVVGLREGTMLEVKDKILKMNGNKKCRIFKYGLSPKELSHSDDFSFLMQ